MVKPFKDIRNYDLEILSEFMKYVLYTVYIVLYRITKTVIELGSREETTKLYHARCYFIHRHITESMFYCMAKDEYCGNYDRGTTTVAGTYTILTVITRNKRPMGRDLTHLSKM